MIRLTHALLAGTIFALCAGSLAEAHTLKEDAKREIVTQHDLSGFDAIDVSGVYLLDVRVGEAFSVTTEATDRDTEWMKIEVEGDTLVLGMKEDRRRRYNERETPGIRARVTLPRLTDLSIAGVASGSVVGIDGGDLNVDSAGVTDIEIKGRCDRLDMDMAGVGEIDAEGLQCRDVRAEVSGVGQLNVYARDSVDAEIGGMGQIDVFGKPENIRTEKSLFSDIDIR